MYVIDSDNVEEVILDNVSFDIDTIIFSDVFYIIKDKTVLI